MKNPKIPKNKTDFFKGYLYCRKIKTQIWGKNGRYTGILKNGWCKNMIEYKNLWSNCEIIRKNPEKYKEWKIDEIITEIMKFLIIHDYNITYENGKIEKHYLNENVNLIEYGFLPILKNMDFSKIEYFCFGIYEHDDYYCILFFDGDYNIINKIFWDFDFTIYYGEQSDFDFMDDFNPFEWL